MLKSLKANGVDLLFVNSGSDFASVIEAYAADGASGDLPRPVVAPHEHAAVAMAHGAYLVTGRPQAVMVHVNVGLANSVMGLVNAHADDVPIVMLSGRTPLTEHDRPGARGTPIQVGQEQFDQTAMVRELVKWDYELRYGENAANLASRACAIAASEPPGAVYLSCPAEPLMEMVEDLTGAQPLQVPAAPPRPDPQAIETAADWLAGGQQSARHRAARRHRGAGRKRHRPHVRATRDAGGGSVRHPQRHADRPPHAGRPRSDGASGRGRCGAGGRYRVLPGSRSMPAPDPTPG